MRSVAQRSLIAQTHALARTLLAHISFYITPLSLSHAFAGSFPFFFFPDVIFAGKLARVLMGAPAGAPARPPPPLPR